MYLLQLKTKLYSLFLRSCSYEKYKFYVNYNYVKVLGKHVCVYILHRQWDYCSFAKKKKNKNKQNKQTQSKNINNKNNKKQKAKNKHRK
jgi:hypothetical protein